MKGIKLVVITMILAYSQSTLSGDQAKKEAEVLLNMMGMETALNQSIQQMLQVQLQQKPALLPYKEVMLKFFAKHMSYESLKPDMINIYAEAFTAKELSEINQFYRTPTGRKTIQVMPTLMGKGAQIGVARVQKNIGELQQMIQQESKRLKESQAKESQ